MLWILELVAAVAAATADTRGRVGATAPPAYVSGLSPAVTYRSRDGQSFFRFRFAPVAGGFRIYILEIPRPGMGSCHVLRDAQGPFICWTQSIRSLEAAKAVAALWAEATIVYQRLGRSF